MFNSRKMELYLLLFSTMTKEFVFWVAKHLVVDLIN